MTTRKKHYVNNPDFYAAIIEYKRKLADNPNTRIPDYIGVCITEICRRLANRPNFGGYTFKDEMIADATEGCIRAVHLFNPEKTDNPFAYFTQIAWNNFLRRIAMEKKEQYLKHKNVQHVYLAGEHEMTFGDTGAGFQLRDNEASNEIISRYEEKLTKAKKPDIIKGVEKFFE